MWQEVVSRLRDYDSATRQEKQEVQGHVYLSLQKEVRELRSLLTKGGGKGQKAQTKKTCWSCGKAGHVQKECRSGGAKTVKKVKKGNGRGNRS